MIRAALIDLDGTLLDTVPDIANAINGMRIELGLPALREDVLATYIGKGSANLVRRCLPEPMAQDPEKFQLALERYYVLYEACNGERARVFEGVLAGLRALQQQRIRLAVVTNKPGPFAVPLLQGVGLAGFFDVVLGGDATERRKPLPDLLWMACERLQVSADQAVMIGDSLNDVQAARAAGCRVLAVPYGYNEGQDIRSLQVDAHVADLVAAASWIEQINQGLIA